MIDTIGTSAQFPLSEIGKAWRGFLAGAGRFGAEVPAATPRELRPDMPPTRAVLNAIAAGADAIAAKNESEAGEAWGPLQAGFDVHIQPGIVVAAFGSGRSRIKFRVTPLGCDVCAGADTDEDSDDAADSIAARWKACADEIATVPR